MPNKQHKNQKGLRGGGTKHSVALILNLPKDHLQTKATHFLMPNDRNSVRHKFIMSRHETVNKRIKQFNVLVEEFRHDLSQHKLCFHAIVNITSIIIKNEAKLFSIF